VNGSGNERIIKHREVFCPLKNPKGTNINHNMSTSSYHRTTRQYLPLGL